MRRFLLTLMLLLSACAPAATPSQTPQVLKIHASAATQPWLAQAYQCADGLNLILQTVNDPRQADLSLQLGEPESLSTPAYQIGQDNLQVVTRPDSNLKNLSLKDVQALFTATNPGDVQLWVYPAREDVQQIFAREVLRGQTLNSFARVAASPQQMADSLGQDKNAVGILTGKWQTGALREVFSLPNLPVLAIVQSEPQGSLKSLLACLQK